MPQSHRSVAFSGKKKKEQLKAKRERKKVTDSAEGMDTEVRRRGQPPQQRTLLSEAILAKLSPAENMLQEVEAINQQPSTAGRGGHANRYNLKFRKETPEEVAERKAKHYLPLVPGCVPEAQMEASSETFYPPGLGYPARPPWHKGMSLRELDASENRHLRLFSERLDREFADRELSLYELNLETWRQLWRVTEMSDVLLIIVDARYPVAQFPPYLYHHLVEEENKSIVLVLNKVDLVPPALVLAWTKYFTSTFPRLLVVPFSCYEGRPDPRSKQRLAAHSSLRLVQACEKLIQGAVDLAPWRSKIEAEWDQEVEDVAGWEAEEGVREEVEGSNTQPQEHQRFLDGILTLGTVGHPNVGKSSVINALMGRKVVSVSKTPGHTKHFQTIFLTKTVRLCDCPGLVFPSTVSRPLQVVQGSYPISQVRDPIAVVHYIASRIDVPSLLGLNAAGLLKQIDDTPKAQWTAFYICEAWAIKRGYKTRKRGQPDVARAANELLRMCLNGQKRLVLMLLPPGYGSQQAGFEEDPGVEEVKQIQGVPVQKVEEAQESQDEEEEEEEEMDEEDSSGEGESQEEERSEKAAVANKFALLAGDE